MSTLRARLEPLRQPVEVDAIQTVVAAAETAVRGTSEALARRIGEVIEELQRCQNDVAAAIEYADEVQGATGAGQGLMATLRSTLDQETVEENRTRSVQNLTGSILVLARRVRLALMLQEEANGLPDELGFAVSALRDLSVRARGAGLNTDVQFIQSTIVRLNELESRLTGLPARLPGPIRVARQTVEQARRHLAGLRAGERAATLGESLFDDILPPDGGKFTQAARGYVQDRAGDWMLDTDRSGVSHQQTLDELRGLVDGASEDERREEALRRAAEEELDDLE